MRSVQWSRAGRCVAAALMACVLLAATGGARAQQTDLTNQAAPTAQPPEPSGPRAETGGAQTLEDILARQRGEAVSNEFRATGDGAEQAASDLRGQLGPLGSASDADVFRQIRFGTGDVTVSTGRPVDAVLIQDGGMRWLEWRRGPVAHYGLYALGAVLLLLALFFIVRGRIRIASGWSGVMIERFGAVERFGHWLLAGSFILLALTGLMQLFGRLYLIPLIGRDAFSTAATAGKWVHDNVAWAFMAGLVIAFVAWVLHNLPSRTDVAWLLKGGGFFSRHDHPPARKFNAGQKIVFWAVIILGVSISASGLSLLFPFELPMFAKTFAAIDHAAGWVGLEPDLPTELQPHQEMQFAQLWHVIVAFALIAVIFGHIYIGTIGMQGAFSAMGSGKVDLNWAREHHSLWVEEMERKGGDVPGGAARPTAAE